MIKTPEVLRKSKMARLHSVRKAVHYLFHLVFASRNPEPLLNVVNETGKQVFL